MFKDGRIGHFMDEAPARPTKRDDKLKNQVMNIINKFF